MYCGVGKSGSPAPNPMTGRPAALRALALASTARVADSAMAARRAETRVGDGVLGVWMCSVTRLWCHGTLLPAARRRACRQAARRGSRPGVFDQALPDAYTRSLVASPARLDRALHPPRVG